MFRRVLFRSPNQGVSVNTSETDTITIELHDAILTSNIVYETKGLLSTAGYSTITIPSTLFGNSYYVVLKHRNSVQTWSASPVLMNSFVTGYNFTIPANVYGGNVVEVEPNSGWFGIYSGDINQDEFVDPYDNSILQQDNLDFASGYYPSDLNGDGFVDPYDSMIFGLNNINFVMSDHP